MCRAGPWAWKIPSRSRFFSIADSSHPAFIDSLRTTNDGNWGVWENASLERAFVADEYDGLAVVDISNLNNPTLKTWVLKTGSATDLSIDGQHCYVASDYVGMRLLDVSDPTRPTCISGLDSAFVGMDCNTITARDSFAYMGWLADHNFCTVSVADPLHPQIVAGCSMGGPPQDVALRDSFAYVAQDYGFYVINVARPRAPVLLGMCGLPDMMDRCGMVVEDTLAFIANGVSGLQIVNVARPDSPAIVGALTPPNGASDVAVVDTFAYIVSGDLYVTSVANPTLPYLIDSVVLPTFGLSVAVSDSLLFVGSYAYRRPGDIRLFDIRDPGMPVFIGSLGTPEMAWRLSWVEPYLYAACGDAGVLIAETAAVGLQEPEIAARTRREMRVVPNPVAERARVEFGEPFAVDSRLTLYDAAGRLVLTKLVGKEAVSIELKLNGLSPGLYFARVETKTGVLSSKIAKQ